MKNTTNMIAYQNDRLIKRWVKEGESKYCDKVYFQTKRLPKNASEFVREVQKEYKKGRIRAVVFIREQKAMTVREAVDVFERILSGDFSIDW